MAAFQDALENANWSMSYESTNNDKYIWDALAACTTVYKIELPMERNMEDCKAVSYHVCIMVREAKHRDGKKLERSFRSLTLEDCGSNKRLYSMYRWALALLWLIKLTTSMPVEFNPAERKWCSL